MSSDYITVAAVTRGATRRGKRRDRLVVLSTAVKKKAVDDVSVRMAAQFCALLA